MVALSLFREIIILNFKWKFYYRGYVVLHVFLISLISVNKIEKLMEWKTEKLFEFIRKFHLNGNYKMRDWANNEFDRITILQ